MTELYANINDFEDGIPQLKLCRELIFASPDKVVLAVEASDQGFPLFATDDWISLNWGDLEVPYMYWRAIDEEDREYAHFLIECRYAATIATYVRDLGTWVSGQEWPLSHAWMHGLPLQPKDFAAL